MDAGQVEACSVSCTWDGTDARLKELRSEGYEVVVREVETGRFVSDEVLRRLRSDPRTVAIPVIVVSADATSGTFERLRAAGADAYLTKPIDIDEFLDVVERFLPNAGRAHP
jgi:CheY-like chemotaxis protein